MLRIYHCLNCGNRMGCKDIRFCPFCDSPRKRDEHRKAQSRIERERVEQRS